MVGGEIVYSIIQILVFAAIPFFYYLIGCRSAKGARHKH